MAHNINMNNGQASFFSLRENAWHGLGQVVDQPVSAKEAIKLSGLDWEVEKQPLYRKDITPVTSHVAIVRKDNGQGLGIVGADYTPVQNQALFDWFTGLDGFADVTLETAGALGRGETVWILARCKGLRFDIGGDEHQGYMTLINGHAGNRKLIIMPTMVRIVCQNTLQMATSGSKRQNTLVSGWELRHTTNVQSNMDRIRTLYAKTTEAWAQTEQVMRMLAAKPATDEVLDKLFTQPWVKPKLEAGDFSGKPISGIKAAEAAAAAPANTEAEGPSESERASMIADMRKESLMKLYHGPTCATYEATRGTVFAALNAVTEYLEHEAPTRVSKDVPEEDRVAVAKAKRFESANLGGNGNEIKARAFALATELAGV